MSLMIFIPIKSIFIPIKLHVKHLVSLGGGNAYLPTLTAQKVCFNVLKQTYKLFFLLNLGLSCFFLGV